jgi:soluble lytic murein transglycosylase-like protein
VYARTYGVEEELIHAIVKQESCFNEKAHSKAGAIGLMQLMPGTADMMKISNPWNPEQNIQAGVKYISKMLSMFKGKKRYAVAAYNAGPGNVRKYKGIPPFRETKNYVKKVMGEYHRLKKQGLPKSQYSLMNIQ